MKKILFVVIIFLVFVSESFAARSAISSNDSANQAWTKQNSMNLEIYRKTTPTESGFVGIPSEAITSGTINDARIPDGIARDDEIVASPITPDTTDPSKAASAVISDSSEFATAAGSADSVPATGITGTLSDTQIPSGVARDDEVVTAIETALDGFEGGGSTITPAETDSTKAAIAVEAESVPASGIVQDETHRLVSDTEKTAWSDKQDALGYTPESAGNKATDLTSNDTTHYPTTSAVVSGLANKVDTSALVDATVSHATTSGSSDVAGSVLPTKVSGVPGFSKLYEANSTDTDGTGFIGPLSSTAGNIVFRLPATIPTVGYVFKVDSVQTGQTLPDNSTGAIVTLIMAAETGGGASVDDTAFGAGWDGETTEAASKNALYDKIAAMDTQITNMIAAFSAAGLNSFAFTPSVTYPIWANTSPVAISFDVTDTSSTYAVADVDYQRNGTGGFVVDMTDGTGEAWTANVTISTDGAHTVQLEATDNKAGTPNTGQSSVYTINFDATDPVGVADADSTHDGASTFTAAITVTETNLSAVTYSVTHATPASGSCTFSGGKWVTPSLTPTGTDDCVVTFAIVDLATNEATGTDLVLNVDYEAFACSTPTSGNLFNEGFEVAGYETSSGITAVGTVAPDTARPGTDPGDLCESSLLVSDATGNYIRYDNTSGVNEIYAKIYIYPNPDALNSEGATIFIAGNTADVYDRCAQLNIYTSVTLGVIAEGANATAEIALNEDAWNVIDLHIVRNGASTMSVNGGANQNFTARDYPTRYTSAGLIYGDALEGDFYFDRVHIGTSAIQ